MHVAIASAWTHNRGVQSSGMAVGPKATDLVHSVIRMPFAVRLVRVLSLFERSTVFGRVEQQEPGSLRHCLLPSIRLIN